VFGKGECVYDGTASMYSANVETGDRFPINLFANRQTLSSGLMVMGI